jgi:hypothetical protein
LAAAGLRAGRELGVGPATWPARTSTRNRRPHHG